MIALTSDNTMLFETSEVIDRMAKKDGNFRTYLENLFSKIPSLDSEQIRNPKGLHFEPLKRFGNQYSLRGNKHDRFILFKLYEPHPDHPKAQRFVIDRYDREHYKKGFQARLLQRPEDVTFI